MKTKEFHLCKEGWRLYDVWVDNLVWGTLDPKFNHMDKYINHRINCHECTKPDKSKLSPVSTLSPNGENM